MTEALTEVHLTNRTVNLTPAERDEWARRAIKVFQGMEYSMTAYARVLTGDPSVRLQMSSGTAHTDGRTIYYRPPLALGDPSPHAGGQCDRRNADGHLICPACSVREFALRQITHEVAHLVGGSFAKAGSMEQQRAVRLGVNAAQNPIARAFLMEQMASAKWGEDILIIMKRMSPFLGTLLMMLEDARIDLKMFRSRQGTRKMFQSVSKRALERGFTRLDGSRQSWAEKPLNAQMMIGLLCKAEGFDYSALHEKIVRDLDDPVLTDLAIQVEQTRTATDLATVAIQTLVRLWELGYCDPPEEIPPPPQPQPQPQDEEPDDEPSVEQSDEDDSGSADESQRDEESPEQDSEGSESDEPELDDPQGSDDSSESGDDAPDGTGSETAEPDVSGSGDDESGGESPDQGDPGAREEGDDPEQGEPSESELGADDDSGSDGEQSTGDLEPGDEEGVDDEFDSEPPGVDADDRGGEGDSGPDGSSVGDPEGEDDPGDEAEDSPRGDDGAGQEDSSQSGDASEGGLGDEQGGAPDESDDDSDSGEESSGLSAPGSTPDSDAEPESDPEGSGAGGEDAPDDDQAEGESDAGEDNSAEPGDSGSATGDEGEGGETGDLATPDGSDVAQGDDDELGGDLDRGADEPFPEDLPDAGSPEDVVDLIQDFSGHNHDDNEEVAALLGSKDEDNEAAVDKAIVQASHFDEPSATVYDIRVFTWPKDDKRSEGWEPYYSNENLTLRIGDKKWSVLQTPEEVLQPALFEMRRVFSDNRRGRYDRNLKRGKLDGRALGRRAWKADDDPRLFKKMERPAKRSYAVIMAGDASTSANNGPLVVEKQAMLAQAELCHRIGIDFEVWFHTADQYQGSLLPKGFDPDYDDAWTQDMYRVKEWREPWTDQAREGLAWMRPVYTNLDGHNLEFLRKRLMASEATTKILLYYTDGEMPAANYQDELETLQREVDLYKRAGIIMLGVGVGTDSPSKWGMDTVRINHKGDVGKVIKHLERRLIMA